ncbi:MAG: hypothetical protein M1821_008953 [Bathelium mastoideum]|nr:MAG: hypothetical protein M1821_008953 [Bathelium mastoideum]KAI9687466.1 MAG: hypothetical protein M1822_002076 [Bathelium mastoideum]
MAHKELNSKADFDSALATKGKYVLVYCYAGEVNPKAEEYASKFAHNTDAYKVDVEKHAAAKEYFGVATTPTVVVYKDGTQLKKIEGGGPENMEAIASVLA